MFYFIGLIAVVGGGMLLRRQFRSRPVPFEYGGQSYVRQRDGSFTSVEGAPVISPQLEAVKAHWDSLDDSSSQG